MRVLRRLLKKYRESKKIDRRGSLHSAYSSDLTSLTVGRSNWVVLTTSVPTRCQDMTNLPVWRVWVSSWVRRPLEATVRGKSCSTVAAPVRSMPARLLVGLVLAASGGLASSLVSRTRRGWGEEEEREAESRNSSSVF